MAAVYHNDSVDIELESGTVFRSFLNHTIGSGDNNANWYGVRVFRNGEPVNLAGCSVQGIFMPSSGSAILISDNTHTWVSENEAAVLLPQACYNVKGQFTLAIKIIGVTAYTTTGTVRIVDGVVADTYSENPVATTAAVPTYQEILAVYDQMVAVKEGSVRFDIDQTLTAAQMTQARGNIAAASESDVSDLNSAIDELNDTAINDIDLLATEGTYNDYVDIAWVQGKPTLSNNVITFDSDTKSINSGYVAVEPFQTINLSVPSLYKAIIYYVDKNDNTYSYSNSTSWITGTTYTKTIDSLYHYAIIRVVKTDGTAISPSEIRLQEVRFYTNKESQLVTKSEFNAVSEDYYVFKSDVEKKIDSEIGIVFGATQGRIVISGGAITIQSNTSYCYTSYISMTNLDTVYIRVPAGYKINAYLADNISGTHITYDPSNPTNGYITETTAVIEKDLRRPYLIVSTIKDPIGTITPADVKNNIVIYYKNTEDVFAKINAINPMTPNATGGQILYIGDTAVNSGHIDNAVIYSDGIIVAARSNGKIVRIGYDGTEETVLQLSGSNFDWRGLYIDSNENVYASPHASIGSMDINDRGLYRLAKGASAMTKVISLYNTSSSVTTETENNDDTIWTVCEDKKGNLYAGVYAHTVRANPAIYKSTDGGVTWSYLFNFKTSGLASTGMHIHTIIYSKWQDALYCIVGEVNTIFKSTNGGITWTDLEVKLNTKGSAMVATPYGIFIGSDGAYNCDIDLLYNDDVTHQRMYRGIAGTVFALRVSDLTGFLYAFTKIDSSVNSESYYPPATVLDGTTTIEQWEDSVSAAAYNNWLAYHDSVYDDYPDDSIRPQHYTIIISRNGGRTWEPLKRFACSSTYPNGLWTTGYFKNGECLTGRIEDGNILNPVIISEGKHKYVASGCDLSGEILVRTNDSNTVVVL